MKNLKKSKTLPEPFHRNCGKAGKLSEIVEMIEKDPECINAQDPRIGMTLLLNAVKYKQTDIVVYLMRLGADANVRSFIGESPLHFAAENSDAETAELLLSHGAESNWMALDGETPLHLAAFIGDKATMDVLLRYGADPNKTDLMTGRSPLYCAVQCQHLECVALLLAYGADPMVKDKEGNSAFDATDNLEIKKILQSSLEKTLKRPLKSIPEALEEEKNSMVCSFSESFQSLEGSFIESYCVSPPSEVLPTQKYGFEDTTSSTPNIQMDPKLTKFLKSLKLTYIKDLLFTHGFDDLEMLTFQMSSPFPITHETLESIGISKHGHRSRFLMKLEQHAGLSLPSTNSTGNLGIQWKCCEKKHNFAPGVGSLHGWLTLIKLEQYEKNFEQAGYEDLQFLVSLMNSRYPVDDDLLAKIGINKVGYRMRVLGKLMEDAKVCKNTNGKETCNLL